MMGETASLILLIVLCLAVLIAVPLFWHRACPAKVSAMLNRAPFHSLFHASSFHASKYTSRCTRSINSLLAGTMLLFLSSLFFILSPADANISPLSALMGQAKALLRDGLFWLAVTLLALHWVCGTRPFKAENRGTDDLRGERMGELMALSVVTAGALFLVLIALPGQMGLQSLLAAALVPALVLIAVAYGAGRRAATGAKDILPLSRVILFLTLLFLGLILVGLMSPLFAGMFLALCLVAIGYETSYEAGYKKSIALIAAPIAFSFALLFCVVLAAQIIYTLFDLWDGAASLQTSLVEIGAGLFMALAGLFMALAGLFLARFYHPLLIAALLAPLCFELFTPPLLVVLIFSLWLLAAPEGAIADMPPAEKYVKAAAFALGAIALLWPQGALWVPRLIFG